LPLEPDDLHKPLGLPGGSARRRLPNARLMASGLVLGAAVAGFGLLFGKTDHAGEPFATAEIAPAAPESTGAIAKSAKDASQTADDGSQPGQRLRATAAEVESESGVIVVRQGGGSAPGALVIRVPDAPSTLKLAAAPDPRLVERSEFGPLPRIGADGSRPAQVYARQAMLSAKGRPRIALVIGGLGLNDQTTADAVARLPGEVSLAFAPYGANLKTQAAKARDAGHEILLQMPMEPFDYPQNNPGPQTLTTEAGAPQNLERLHWVMSRASGFVGIENFLGARFTSDEASISPVLKDLAARGLIYVDDGSSARSVAPVIAASLGLPVRRADVVIDAAPTAAMIDSALDRLEAMAREKGIASGSGAALPITIERLSRWATGLAERGIDLVPISSTVDLKAKG
jgi:uncharacterized protein